MVIWTQEASLQELAQSGELFTDLLVKIQEVKSWGSSTTKTDGQRTKRTKTDIYEAVAWWVSIVRLCKVLHAIA